MAVKERGRPSKYKICPDCNRRKLLAKDFYHWDDDGPRTSRQCKLCVRERRKKRYEQVMADPYLRARLNKRKLQWEANKRHRNPAVCRAYRARLKAERPEVYEQQLEDARIRGRLRKERLNPKAPITTKRAPLPREPLVYVPVEPLRQFLSRVDFDNAVVSVGETAMRTAFKVLHEDRAEISERAADRVLTAFNGTLISVYPELYS